MEISATDPERGGGLDGDELARRVAADLRALYGSRLRKVVLFGSRARGDATPESDLDLLVVLDQTEDHWREHDRMDDVLWRHTLESGIVVSAIPFGESELSATHAPALKRAQIEGRTVG